MRIGGEKRNKDIKYIYFSLSLNFEVIDNIINRGKNTTWLTIIKNYDSGAHIFHYVINTGNGISEVRFRGNVINGKLIEDAYIYRLTN